MFSRIWLFDRRCLLLVFLELSVGDSVLLEFPVIGYEFGNVFESGSDVLPKLSSPSWPTGSTIRWCVVGERWSIVISPSTSSVDEDGLRLPPEPEECSCLWGSALRNGYSDAAAMKRSPGWWRRGIVLAVPDWSANIIDWWCKWWKGEGRLAFGTLVYGECEWDCWWIIDCRENDWWVRWWRWLGCPNTCWTRWDGRKVELDGSHEEERGLMSPLWLDGTDWLPVKLNICERVDRTFNCSSYSSLLFSLPSMQDFCENCSVEYGWWWVEIFEYDWIW